MSDEKIRIDLCGEFVLSTFIFCCWFLIIVFYGKPDLIDAMIYWLMK